MTKEKSYTYINNGDALPEACSKLEMASVIAFDLEFDRDRNTYGFDLCLVQVATPEHCFIIDPLYIEDLSLLFRIFTNPAIQKLVHCPGEDLRLLHSLGCYPQNMGDTEVIAKLLNYEQTSLAKLLDIKCNIQLNKKMQQSNWHQRPLREEQLYYAAEDVIYLHQLFNLLREEAAEQGIEKMVEEEFDWLQTVRYTLEPKTNFLKPGDIKNLSPKHQYILNEIYLVRDEIARRKNKPAFMIMPDELVRFLAESPHNFQNIQPRSGLHPSLRHGTAAEQIQMQLEAIFKRSGQSDLSENLQRNYFSLAERAAWQRRKNRQQRLKDDLFTPVQKYMADKMGANAARYMLSNAWITRWLLGEVKWESLQPPYKRKLVREAAEALKAPFTELAAYEGDYFTEKD